MRYLLATALVLCLASCSPEPEGLTEGAAGFGPTVVWDLEAKPLPEIPFPNDLATRLDETSPTQRRLNLSLLAPTELEEEIRAKADLLDGFGTFAPITVGFDAAIDLDDLRTRQVENRDWADDAVFVIDITPGSPTYGQPVPLDMGRGFFPATLKNPGAYFPGDPRKDGSNLLFESYKETGGTDSDADGVKDVPNVWPAGGDPWEDLLVHYERETSTLLLRPVVPLRERTRYAVVLTRRLHGQKATGPACSADDQCESGSCDASAKKCREPVRSPFRFANHTRQTEDLAPLKEILPGKPFRLDVSDIAFAWTFTTQSVTADLVAIRNGLYGTGKLARLAEEFPATVALMPAKTEAKGAETGSIYRVTIDELMDIAAPLLPQLSGMIPSLADSMDVLLDSYDHVDSLIAGTFESPDFMVDRDGLAAPGHPANDDESFELDPATGQAVYGHGQVPFICIIPKEKPQYQDRDWPAHGGKKPFPVAIFMHGTASSKLQAMGFAGHFARLGIATCSIDAFAHGMPFPLYAPEGSLMHEGSVKALIGLFADGYQPIYDIIRGMRVRDLNMDGNLDPAGDFWTMDPFHTRDCIRQTVVDLVQLLRILRAMDGKRTADLDGDGKAEPFGDFDRDGNVELGGPDNRYFAYGISLGGIVTSVFAGVEPALDAAVPIVAGGGLADVAVRSTNPGVPEMAVLPALGPIVVGEVTKGSAEVPLRFVMPAFDHYDMLEMARLTKAAPGDRLVLANLDTGETAWAVLPGEGEFRVQLAADALRATEIRGFTGFDPQQHLGMEDCTKDGDCAAPMKCASGLCKCSDDATCPDGYRCSGNGLCAARPPVLDSTLATAGHPALGDRFRFELFDAEGKSRELIDAFGSDVEANGAVYPKGEPLVNLYRGFGNPRQTPKFRRFMMIAQTILEPADPVNWAPHFAVEPIPYPADPDAKPGTNVLLLLGDGDTNVPAATGISIARAAGIIDFSTEDERLGGLTEMDALVQMHVVEGVHNRCHYSLAVFDKGGIPHQECLLYDPDDLDNSRLVSDCTDCRYTYDDKDAVTGWVCSSGATPCGDGFGMPFDLPEPIRATARVAADGLVPARPDACEDENADGTCRLFRDKQGILGLRIAVTKPQGFHGIYLMAPYKPFDIETYQLNLIERYFISSGRELWDDVCLESNSCDWEP